ncbi:unnamed protein product [Ixodes hexagonus]
MSFVVTGATRRQRWKDSNIIEGEGSTDVEDMVPNYGAGDCLLHPDERHQEVLRLKKEVGLFSSITLLLGCIIGTGIYVSPGTVLKNAGSVENALLVWTAAGLNSLIGNNISYMITVNPIEPPHRTGKMSLMGQSQSVGKLDGQMVTSRGTGVRITGKALSPVRHKHEVKKTIPPSGGLNVLIFVFISAAANAANVFSVSMSARVQDVFSGIKCALLFVIIITGIVYSFKVNHIHDPSYSSGNILPGDIAAAFYSAAYTFSGWGAANNIAEEVKNPARNIPLAIVASVLITTAAYLLTNLAFFIAMDSDTIIASDAIVVAFIRSTWGPSLAALVPLMISLSLFGSTCGEVFAYARVTFAAARQGHLPDFLSYIHVKTAVPMASIIARCLLSCLYTLTGSVTFLIEANVLFDATWDIVSVVALLMLRRSMAKATRTIRVPIVLVILRLAICIAMATVPLSQVRRYRFHYIVVLVTCLCGVIYYAAFVRLKVALPGGATVSRAVQKCLNSAACVNELDLILKHRSDSEVSLIKR